MARPRQVKKNRSSRPRVKTGMSGRTKAGKKKVNFLGNDTIRQNWNRKLTLAQNYENLGLAVKLKGRAGGTEKGNKTGAFAISSGIKPDRIEPGEVQVVRDADGHILEIIDPEASTKKANPLHDPLNDLEDESDGDIHANVAHPTANKVVAQLEAQAAAEEEELARTKKPRQQSTREQEWVESLVEKHGDDYSAMFRDRKLNPMQQSEGDLKRRVKKWKAKHG